jgi:hypothetical protein
MKYRGARPEATFLGFRAGRDAPPRLLGRRRARPFRSGYDLVGAGSTRRPAAVHCCAVNEPPDEVEKRLRTLLGRRHFVDRETGVLLVWLPADTSDELSELVGELGSRHPATRFSLQETGSAVAVRMSARDQELAEIEALYVAD